MKKLEKIFKALGDRNRLRIINILSQKSLCVCELTNILPLSQSTVSGHLRVLKDANLLEYRKEKLWVEYDLNDHDAVEKEILELVIKKLDGDPSMYEDRERALTVDRNQILCKN